MYSNTIYKYKLRHAPQREGIIPLETLRKPSKRKENG